MMDFLKKLFAADFMPHGHCYFWRPEIVWLHVVSDSLITLAYYSIPVALACFLRKRKDIPFNWMIWMFGGFIFACGTTHLLNVWTLWVPTYRLDGLVKLCTAAVSMTTAVLLWPLIPKAVALPSPAQLEEANTHLEKEIIERRRSEAQLRRANEEAEAANRELEAFSYSVSHDLRAPLRSIDGFSQALLEDCGDRLDERGRQDLERVRAATRRMGQLIDDLLSLSGVARVEMRRSTVDLSGLARRIAAELEKGQPERKVEFKIAGGLVADGDGRLLKVALENLLRNAWKFTGKRPVAHIEFGATQDDGRRAFFVRDDGAGFDMAYADKLFGAFQRLHSTQDFEGTGIGLATVARIVQRHGGRVWSEGAVDRGATFYFTL